VVRKRKKDDLPSAARPGSAAREAASAPRIIGGSLRGRRLIYTVQHDRTRPMKDRVREAVFNLLGSDVAGKYVVDLFAGTGALAFEALSRGAVRATMIEQHFPTAAVIRQNAAELGIGDRVQVLSASAFLWSEQPTVDSALPWLVFCSPPYAFYIERREAMLGLIGRLVEQAPAQSIFIVESDRRFDTGQLPSADEWQLREYPPAVIAIYRK
jgi:16S rRNA (guanine(966)-N(2))-methyltransferase RsmD